MLREKPKAFLALIVLVSLFIAYTILLIIVPLMRIKSELEPASLPPPTLSQMDRIRLFISNFFTNQSLYLSMVFMVFFLANAVFAYRVVSELRIVDLQKLQVNISLQRTKGEVDEESDGGRSEKFHYSTVFLVYFGTISWILREAYSLALLMIGSPLDFNPLMIIAVSREGRNPISFVMSRIVTWSLLIYVSGAMPFQFFGELRDYLTTVGTKQSLVWAILSVNFIHSVVYLLDKYPEKAKYWQRKINGARFILHSVQRLFLVSLQYMQETFTDSYFMSVLLGGHLLGGNTFNVLYFEKENSKYYPGLYLTVGILMLLASLPLSSGLFGMLLCLLWNVLQLPFMYHMYFCECDEEFDKSFLCKLPGLKRCLRILTSVHAKIENIISDIYESLWRIYLRTPSK